MAKVLIEATEMQSIADAIREKAGTTDKMLPSEMAEAIGNISTGGGDSQLDGLIDGTITELYSEAESVCSSTLANKSNLKKIDLPKAKSISSKGLANMYLLESVNLPMVERIGSSIFNNTNNLTNFCFPSLKEIPSQGLNLMDNLVKADFHVLEKINGYAFEYDKKLSTLIIRSNKLCTLASTNVFNNCYHFTGTVDSTYNPNGLKDAYIYTPRALIDSYKTATNWSAFYTSCDYEIFRALEDYTVDNTITGELDETKI